MGSVNPYVALALALLAGLVGVLGYVLNRRKARHETADRHQAAGPEVEPVRGSLRERTVKVRLRLVGGPHTMTVSVHGNAPWCIGVTDNPDQSPAPGTYVTEPPATPGSEFEVWAHLTVEPHKVADNPLPLRVEVGADDDRPRRWWRRSRRRTWTRHVQVPMQRPTQVW